MSLFHLLQEGRKSSKIDMSEIIRIGHRGAMGYAPGNTIKAVNKALELQVDMVEIDVRICKTGEVVAFHDQKLKRITNGKGYIHKKTLSELKELVVGKGERISTLEEILDVIDKKAQINIELKGKNVFRPVKRIIERYVKDKGWKHEDFLISTFTRSKIKKIAKNKPKFRIGALLGYRPYGFVKFAKKINAYSVNVNINLANEDIIKDAHDSDMKVFVWTANEKEDIDRLKKMGVDGIFSDYPDRI